MDFEIISRVWDENTGWQTEVQLSEEDEFDDLAPRVALRQDIPIKDILCPGIRVVWEGYDGNDYEIYYIFGYECPQGGVEEKGRAIPFTRFSWKQISGSKRVCISYYVPYSTRVNLSIYDPAGRVIDRLVGEFQDQGEKEIIWEPKRAGIYFIRLICDKWVEKKKITILD